MLPLPKRLNHERVHRFAERNEKHSDLKIRIRNDSAWNMGLALATSEQELKLIIVKQVDYPIHLIQKSRNDFLLFYSDGQFSIMPGKVLGSARPSYVGPRYSKVVKWSPIPLPFQKVNPDPTILDCYQILDDIINERPNHFYGIEAIKLAGDLIRRKAVVL